jgi:hypothetical protein
MHSRRRGVDHRNPPSIAAAAAVVVVVVQVTFNK